MKKIALYTLLVLGFVNQAHSSQNTNTEKVAEGLYLNAGELKSVQLDNWKYIEKIYVQAEGANRDATFEVIANGEVKGTIFVPGRDPSYVVTIRDTVNSLQLRHVSGGNVRVNSIVAEVTYEARHGLNPRKSFLGYIAYNKAMEIASHTISVVNSFEDFVDYETFGKYLLPIKKSAARLYAKAAVRGDLSAQTVESLATLHAQIEVACQFIDQELSQNATFELGTELLSIQEEIGNILK